MYTRGRWGSDLLEDLDPQWLLVVGIAGGVPSSDVTLGDVVVSTRIIDFSVEAATADHDRQYAVAGGPLHPTAASIIANLPARRVAALRGRRDRAAVQRARAGAALPKEPAATPPGDAAVNALSSDAVALLSRFGYFSITANAKTLIYLDDKLVGDTPLIRLPLRPGQYKIKAVGPGGKIKHLSTTIYGARDTEEGTITW